MKALIFERFGEPADVLRLGDLPMPEPGPGQVRVRMISSPVNPSDLLVVRGRYGVLPTLPATPGFEGVGVVDKVGPGLNPLGRLVKGKRVCVINSAGGNWAEYAVIPARQARPVPKDLPDEQAAAFFVNPATALAMVRHVLKVPKGAWLLQSAAGSELGKMIIRLGRNDGFRTLNIVRRPEAVEPLKKLGADAVVCSQGPGLVERLAEATQRGLIAHAIDPVGGETASAMLRALAPGGRLLVYGSLSESPISVESRLLIAKRCRIEGFWLGHFMRERSVLQSLALFRQIGVLMTSGVLSTEVAARFPLEAFAAAVATAEAPASHGKVFVQIASA